MKHKHHIIPKHAGGTNDPSNIILLSVEEHAETHQVLYEKYGRWQDRMAWKVLSGQITNQEANRLKRIESNKERWADPEFKKRTSKKISEAKKGRPPWNKGKKQSEEHRRNNSEAQKGLVRGKQSQSHKDKIAAALAKEYIITYPDGHEEKITNLRKWCKENNLHQGALTRVAQGKLKQHKGYKARYA